MKLDTSKFTQVEERSNHAAAAMQYVDCPINEICLYIATGFGGNPTGFCKHLNFKEGECLHPETSEAGP